MTPQHWQHSALIFHQQQQPCAEYPSPQNYALIVAVAGHKSCLLFCDFCAFWGKRSASTVCPAPLFSVLAWFAGTFNSSRAAGVQKFLWLSYLMIVTAASPACHWDDTFWFEWKQATTLMIPSSSHMQVSRGLAKSVMLPNHKFCLYFDNSWIFTQSW
jgi:hypothetical protein